MQKCKLAEYEKYACKKQTDQGEFFSSLASLGGGESAFASYRPPSGKSGRSHGADLPRDPTGGGGVSTGETDFSRSSSPRDPRAGGGTSFGL